MAPSAVNNGARALEGLLARWHKDINGSVATTGSADTYVMAANQTLSAYYDGLMICVDINATNTGASTINVDSLGAKNILKHNDQALAAGDLEANGKYLMIYDGTSFQLLSALGNAPAVIGADNSFTADQTIVSTDAGATEGPALDLHRNSASPADSDVIGALRFKGEDDGSNATTYAKLVGVIDDVTGGEEDGHLSVVTVVAGTLADRFHFGAGLYADGNTDPGVGKIDADDLLISGTSVTPGWATTGQVTVQTGTSVSLVSGLSGVNEIEIHCEAISLDATASPLIQIGDSGGLEVTGYTGFAVSIGGAAVVQDINSTGFLCGENAGHTAATTADFVIKLRHMGSNVWSFDSLGYAATLDRSIHGQGLKTLTGALDRVSITTEGGTANFDGPGIAYVRSR
jgi:hypothetical protein